MSKFGPVEDGSSYLPVHALPYWAHLGPFVNAIVDQCLGGLDRDRESLYAALTPFVLWCWQTRGYELEVSRVFRAKTIEQFISLGAYRYSRGSRATLRSTLWRVLELLAPAEAATARSAIPRSKPTAPYSSREVAAMYSWADSQRTPHRRLDALALIGLGFGAGLATRELLQVTAEDCVLDSNGTIIVKVRGARSRDVPVIDEWRNTVWTALQARTGQLLFRPGRSRASEGQVTDFLLRSRTPVDVKPVRMRTTWLVAHLAAGTDPLTLKTISGLQSLAALDRIATFVPSSGAIFAATSDQNSSNLAADQGFSR